LTDSVTEHASHYDNLEKMSVGELLININREDKTVPEAVERILPEIERLVEKVVSNMRSGGRLFYIGAGTSGRLGIVDASECPPTFGTSPELVVGLIAGGDQAIRKAVEFAEDDPAQGWKDLEAHHINATDTVIGIAASGNTPYVVGAIETAGTKGILTGCITCNPDTPLARVARYPLEVIVGPEFVTGSTRMKAGTAQKLVLNMISTSVMIKLGHVKGNRMVDMQLTNNKLMKRGIEMIRQALGVDYEVARQLLNRHGSVRKVLEQNKPDAGSI